LSNQDAARYLALLGLGPDASLEEIKQAYRDLVNVWHPDRFGHHPRLRAKAEEKLKEVNAAYAWLEAHSELLSDGDEWQERTAPPAPDQPAAAAWRPPHRARAPARKWDARLTSLLLVLVVVAATFLAVLLIDARRRAWFTAERPGTATPAPASASPKGAAPNGSEGERRPSSRPPRWPWRGVTVGAATDAAPGDVRALLDFLGPRFNYVRLTLDGRVIAEREHLSPESAWSRALAWADAMLDACHEAGLVCTVALNQVPHGVTETSPQFWENPERLAEVVRLAGLLAQHLQRRGGELGGYEVLPKPFVLEGNRAKVPRAWPALMRDLIAEIRRHDAGHWIVVAPGPGGLVTGYRHFAPVDDPKVIYAANTYVPLVYTHQGLGRHAAGIAYPGLAGTRYWDEAALTRSLRALRAFQTRYRVPVLIDEFGCVRWAPGCGRYLADLGHIFSGYQWSWAYFGYKAGHAWNPDYDPVYRSDGSPAEERGYVGPGSERWKQLQALFARFGADSPASDAG